MTAKKWRIINSLGWLLAIAIGLYNTHTIHDCESATFEHVTGQEAPTQGELE